RDALSLPCFHSGEHEEGYGSVWRVSKHLVLFHRCGRLIAAPTFFAATNKKRKLALPLFSF
ncbi:MAG: hypothetical protein J6L88_01395, partial [Clostridia bacterium]|nr:hypothetical protein [Clostridia bacterium]